MKFIKFDYTPFPGTVTLEGVKWRLTSTGRQPVRANQVGKQNLVRGSILICLGGDKPIAISTDGELMSLQNGWDEIADNQWLYPVENPTQPSKRKTKKTTIKQKKEKHENPSN